MPDLDIYQYMVQQGGWAVLALTMFLLARKDSQQNQEKLIKLVERSHEQVEVFLRFGERRGQLETQMVETLHEIKDFLGKVQICPVSMITSEETHQLGMSRGEAVKTLREVLKARE